MSAQGGLTLLLDYGSQGARQAGNTLSLLENPPITGLTVAAATTKGLWRSALRSHSAVRAPFVPAQRFDSMARAPWAKGAHKSAHCTGPWGLATRRDTGNALPWSRFGNHATTQAVAAWLIALRNDVARALPWGRYALHVGLSPSAPWVVSAKLDSESTTPWGQYLFAQLQALHRWVGGKPGDAERYIPWTRFSRQMSPGWGIVSPPETDLTSALFAILPARFYMSAHTIFAQTLPGLASVPIFDATVSADSGSYCWSLSATGPASLFEQLAPVDGLPAQIKLTLDGLPWVFAVDSLSRSTAFGQSSVRVQGRSLTALIAAPYLRSTTRANEFDRTAQQLGEDALTGTGIALDWGIGAGALSNGGMVDWLVPAGAFSHAGTPLDALQAIVQAAGGYLQSHRSAATLQARHPYGQRVGDTSGAPWGWDSGAADVELAPDALITSSIARHDGPDINAVYVSGTTTGVLALVKRTSSAADKLAAMVSDPLITHADAARQRGLAILGAAGHKYAVSLELPVLTGIGQPGVLDVGQLVQVNASVPWRARVRGVSVSAKQPTLRQTITLERHLETA